MTENNKKLVVLGIYTSIAAADVAVERFKTAGFSNTDISALLPEGDQTKEFAHQKGTKAPEGATTGGATGALLGGTLGWLVGVGSLAIPGVGPLIAAGPIMATLAGIGVGTTVGALSGALVGMGIPEYEAKRYEGRVKDGGVLVSIHCSSSEKKENAIDVFEQTGASDISSTTASASDTRSDSHSAHA